MSKVHISALGSKGLEERVTIHETVGDSDDIPAKIAAAIHNAPVVVFGKKHCPFCIDVRRLFAELHVQTLDIDVGAQPDGAEIWKHLKAQYAQKTVPYVFINQALVGGCDSVKKLQAEGQLTKLLAAAGVKSKLAPPTNLQARVARSGVLEGGQPAGGTLFHFPDVVDNRVVRMNGLWSVITCLLVAIFYKRVAAHWVMGGLMVEYCARLLGGSNASALGSLSAVIASAMDALGGKPRFVAGPPKQFAALCGVMFSSLAFFFYLVSSHEAKLINVGLAFTCGLGMAALLESAINFCLGCWMFGLMIRFGLVSDRVYQTFIDSKAETEYTWTEMNKRLNEGAPPALVKHFHEEHPLTVDYKYKAKTDDMTREEFHPIKHVKLSHFTMIMGIVGLACAWKAAAGLGAPAAVWDAIGVASAVMYGIWVLLYGLKVVMYPRKVCKELMHNIHGSGVAAPWIILVLFAYLEAERDLVFAKVLFWIGAPTSLFLSFLWVSFWIANKKEMEHVHASWMITPVANFVAAAVGPILDLSYRDAMQLWFAFAFLFWLALFAITLYRAFVMPEYDDRARPMLAAWVAAPAVAAIAYVSCYGPQAATFTAMTSQLASAGFNDFVFINLHWMAVTIAIVLALCFYRPYFGRLRFDMSYWAGGFPTAALCLCSIYYHALKPGNLSAALAYTTLFISSWVQAILALQTLAALLRLQVFTPDYKWGPLSFMRLSHEALRDVVRRLAAEAKDCGNGEQALAALRATWAAMSLVHREHGRHEDDVIFRVYEEFFPGVTGEADEQHHQLEAASQKLDKLLAEAESIVSGPAAAAIMEAVDSYAAALAEHLRWEEDHLQAMPRKYIPLALAKNIVRECWAATPAQTWHTLLPLLVESMPMFQQRVRFLKTLLWAMPERCHHLGLILAKGLDAVNWRRITQELPELVPRGVSMLWERYY